MRKRINALFSGVDLRGVIATLAMRFAGAGVGFFGHVAYARLLGQTHYGLYAGLWAWVVLLGMLAPLGLAMANTRLAAQFLEKKQAGHLKGLFSFAILMPLISGAIFGAAFAAFEFATMHADAPVNMTAALVLAAVSIPLFALGESMRGFARGHGLTLLAYAPAFLWRPLLILVFALVAFAYLGQATVNVLMAASLLALVVTVLAQAGLLRRHLDLPARLPAVRTPGAWLGIALPLLLMDGYFILAANTDVIVLRHFAPAEDVGAYYAATRIAALVNFFPLMIGAQAAPQMARLWTRGERELLIRIGRRYAWLAFLGTATAFTGLVWLGDIALALFGRGFAVARPAMLILAGGIALQALSGPVRYVLAMCGQERAMAMVMSGAAVLNVALNLVLIPAFGMLGAAGATTLSNLALAAALACLAWQRLKIWVGVGPPM